MSDAKPLHVVVAAIVDEMGRVLIARRHETLHQGGLWEFPGGKVEPGEKVTAALYRELEEEIGVTPERFRPLVTIPFSYPDRRVILDVWRVEAFSGTPHGREGQPVEWVTIEALDAYPFPAANQAIITALTLPGLYLITPEPGQRPQWRRFLQQLELSLQSGIEMVQFRAKQLATQDYLALAAEVVHLCRDHKVRVLLNGEPDWVESVGADGIQLTSMQLCALERRPLPESLLVGGSCHSNEELRRAEALGVDFALLSPVKSTLSHPETVPLGWDQFRIMANGSGLPLYALGGMSSGDLERAWLHGGQGVAAIRSLWAAS